MADDKNEKERNYREPLLNNNNNNNNNDDNGYYENCPGCKVDQAKQMNHGLPFRQLLNVWMVTVCTALPVSCLFPFLYFMIRDFGIAKMEADIGFYSGYVGSSFMLGRALTSIPWGIFADRYGRKYAIVVGLVAVVVLNTLFGLSTSFSMAVSTRFLLGSLNGSLGPIKAYASELFPEEYQALGLSTVNSAWGVALVVGPALGGYLAQPAEKYPHIFPKGSLFDKFPYLLPCFIISLVALAVLVACIWLPETLHNHNSSDKSNEDTEALENEVTENTVQKDENLLLNWPLMSSIIVYCVFSLHDLAYTEVFSLWAVSPEELGGLNFTTDDVGNVLSISGFTLLLYQIFVYPSIQKVCGPVRLSHISGATSIPLLQSYPFIALFSGFPLRLFITIASVLELCLSVTIITGLFLLQNRAVEQHQRGAANGIAMTGMSIFKAIGPAGGGAVVTWSQKRLGASFLPGSHMIFFVLNLVEVLGLVMMFKPFLAEKKKTPSQQLQ